MPFNKVEFLKFTYNMAERLKLPHHFNKETKIAGKQFYYDFMVSHPELALRKPESTSFQRALGFNKHQVGKFFSKYSELLAKCNFSANRIYNCDETGVFC